MSWETRRGRSDGRVTERSRSGHPMDFSTARRQPAWGASVSSTGSSGSEDRLGPPEIDYLNEGGPRPLGQAGHGGGAERSGLERGGSCATRHAAVLPPGRLEGSMAGGAPVRPRARRVGGRRGGHGIGNLTHLERHGFNAGPGQMGAADATRKRPVTTPPRRGSRPRQQLPVTAGTKVTPPLSGTDSASGSRSAAEAMMPRPSRSHWMAAPETTKVDPSRA